jgi:hypothetical protein
MAIKVATQAFVAIATTIAISTVAGIANATPEHEHQPPAHPAPMPVQPAPTAQPSTTNFVVPVLTTQNANLTANQKAEAKATAAGTGIGFGGAGGSVKNDIGIGNEANLTGGNNQATLTGGNTGGNNLTSIFEAEQHPAAAVAPAAAGPAGQGSGYTYNSNNGMCSLNLSAYAGLNSDQVSPGVQFFGFGARVDVSNTRQQMEANVRQTHGQNLIAIAADTATRFGNRHNSTAARLAGLSMKAAAANTENADTAKTYNQIGSEMSQLDFSNDCTPVQPATPAPAPNPWAGYEGWNTPSPTPATPAGGQR